MAKVQRDNNPGNRLAVASGLVCMRHGGVPLRDCEGCKAEREGKRLAAAELVRSLCAEGDEQPGRVESAADAPAARRRRSKARSVDTDESRFDKLLGFDVAGTKKALRGWLDENEGDEPSERDRAAGEALRVIEGVTRMWLPEIEADREWHKALSDVAAALETFAESAATRTGQLSTHLERTHGSGRAGLAARLSHVSALEALTLELLGALGDGHISTADGFGLFRSASETKGAPPLWVLGRVEYLLFEGGFTYAEIASLVRELGRGQRGRKGRTSKRVSGERKRLREQAKAGA